MVRNILFALLFALAMVGCSDDDDGISFLRKYEGVIWMTRLDEGTTNERIHYSRFKDDLNTFIEGWNTESNDDNKDCFYYTEFQVNIDEGHLVEIIENHNNRFEYFYTELLNDEVSYTQHVTLTVNGDILNLKSIYAFYPVGPEGVNNIIFKKSSDRIEDLLICQYD